MWAEVVWVQEVPVVVGMVWAAEGTALAAEGMVWAEEGMAEGTVAALVVV